MVDPLDAIVIGGGQAGLASGYHLQKNRLQFLILEANDQAAGSWPQYYDSLKLFSPARFSAVLILVKNQLTRIYTDVRNRPRMCSVSR
ncbi:MAG: oxidoreductase [Paenibacillus sp.]|jgi:putative flavoprotein involved in K+ transport|nr:oxidoreductase [Paenibacillus sp.]